MSASSTERSRSWRARLADRGVKEGGPSGAAKRKRATSSAKRSELRGRRAKAPLPWLFVDTEGANDEEGYFGEPGRQHTVVISAADDAGHSYERCTGAPLSTVELTDFIFALPPRTRLGGYFFAYDVDMILSDLSGQALRLIYQERHRARHDLYTYRLEGTSLKIGREDGASRRIWDVGRIWQQAFARAIDSWQIATAEERAFIEGMKELRASFTMAYFREHRRRICDYSIAENRLAARLQQRFDDLCAEHGFPLSAWHSAASVSKAKASAAGVKGLVRDHSELHPHFQRAVISSYFGGRTEILYPGRYGPVYEADVRSCYPAAMPLLPCLVHTRWHLLRFGAPDEIHPHDLTRVQWRIPRSHRWGPFPARVGAGVHFPSAGAGYVWGVELLAALRCWRRVTMHHEDRRAGICLYPYEYWQAERRCDCEPLAWVSELYDLRAELEAEGRARGFPMKIALNALYGSFASVLGADRDRRPPWFAPIWAAWITAYGRSRMLEALRASGGPLHSSVIMFMTDAAYSTERLPLDYGEGLGQWEASRYRWGFLANTGVYHLAGRGRDKLRSRGWGEAEFRENLPQVMRAWRRDGMAGEHTITTAPRFHGTRWCLHTGHLTDRHKWLPLDRTLGFDLGHKRDVRAGTGWPPLASAPWNPRTHPWAAIGADSDELSAEELEGKAQLDGDELLATEQPQGPYDTHG